MSTALQMHSLEEALSDQVIRWCCIDRLSWQDFSGLGHATLQSLLRLAQMANLL